MNEPQRPLAPVPAAAELWRSPAFASTELSPHLRRLHAVDVLQAARHGNADAAASLLTTWIEGHP